jgi:hypothetical protein
LRLWTANALAALSFVVFAFAVLSLHQERSIPFVIEENGPFPVVLSHFLFGASGGLVDSSLSNFFWRDVPGVPAEEAVERAIDRTFVQAHDLAPMQDGNGIGAIVMVRIAFALFGVHAHALPYFFILVLGLSTAAFIFRYQDKRIFAVPALFMAFTALILTSVTSPGWDSQVPFGGVRSYAIVGILAALHWCFELTVDRTVFRFGDRMRWFLLSVQIAVLSLAILVRGSPIYLLGPVFAVAIYQIRRNWGKPGLLRVILLRLAIPAAALIVIPSSIAPLAFPDYVRGGRAATLVWHRVLISFGVHPEWPFAGLRETYRCPGIPEGLVMSVVDRNGHCVWLAYAQAHALSSEQLTLGVYGAEYERTMRAAVFDIARTHPKEAFETFFFYKPELLVSITRNMLRLKWLDAPPFTCVLFLLQFAIVIAFIAGWPIRAALVDAAQATGLASIFLIFSTIPQFAAWSVPSTMTDFFVYVVCGGVMASWLAFVATTRAIGRLVPALRRSYGL